MTNRAPTHLPVYTAALLLFHLLPVSAMGQGTIAGTVRNAATGLPLAGAQVAIAALSMGGITGPDGQFEVGDVPAGTHTVEISLIGYATVTREVTVSAGQEARLDAELSETALALEGWSRWGVGPAPAP